MSQRAARLATFSAVCEQRPRTSSRESATRLMGSRLLPMPMPMTPMPISFIMFFARLILSVGASLVGAFWKSVQRVPTRGTPTEDLPAHGHGDGVVQFLGAALGLVGRQ